MSLNIKDKSLLFVVFICSIYLRIDYELVFFDLYVDKAFQVLASQNLVEGRGLNIIYPVIDNLSEESLSNLVGYPPAYSYVLSLFYPFLDIIESTKLVDGIAIVLIFVSLWIILEKTNVRVLHRGVIFLFFGLSPTPFGYLTSTDLIVTSFGFLSVSIFLISYNKWYSIFLALITFFPIVIKYSAIPMIALVPGLFFVVYLVEKKRELLIKGGANLILTLSLIISFSYFFPSHAKSKVFEKGFYFGQLERLDSFLFKAFYYVEFYVKLLFKDFEGGLFFLMLLVSIGLLVFLVVKSISLIIKKDNKELMLLLSAASISSLLLLVALSYLSIRTKGEEWQDPYWTYVEETRYYGVAMILTQIAMICYIVNQLSYRDWFNKALRGFVALGVLFSMIYGVKQFVNVHVLDNQLFTYESNNKEWLRISEMIKEEKRYLVDPNKILYYSSSQFENVFVTINSPIYKFITSTDVKGKRLTTSEDITLFIHCTEEEIKKHERYSDISVYKILPLSVDNLYICGLKSTR